MRMSMRPAMLKRPGQSEMDDLISHLANAELEIRTDYTPVNALTGLEGMQAAHDFLKINHAYGILIGGTLDALWTPGTTRESLKDHKDVDVLVFNYSGNPCDKVPGIDWHVRKNKPLEILDEGSKYDKTVLWCQSTLGQSLRYDAELFLNSEGQFWKVSETSPMPARGFEISPGLLIPGREHLISMRVKEAVSAAQPNYVAKFGAQDMDLHYEAYLKKLRGKSKVTGYVPPFVNKNFPGRILSPQYYHNLSRFAELYISGLEPNAFDSVQKHIQIKSD